jgi:hypothetical protein
MTTDKSIAESETFMTSLDLRTANASIIQLFEKLSGPDSTLWFLTLNRILRDGVPSRFQSWRTVRLRTFPSTDALLDTLRTEKYCLKSWAVDILRKSSVTSADTEVNLVNLTVSDLGFSRAVQSERIYARARELGLDLCTPDVGPQLRLQYEDQPQQERLFIGMVPIMGTDGYDLVFQLYNRERPWLSTREVGPNEFFLPEHHFVFARHKT